MFQQVKRIESFIKMAIQSVWNMVLRRYADIRKGTVVKETKDANKYN